MNIAPSINNSDNINVVSSHCVDQAIGGDNHLPVVRDALFQEFRHDFPLPRIAAQPGSFR